MQNRAELFYFSPFSAPAGEKRAGVEKQGQSLKGPLDLKIPNANGSNPKEAPNGQLFLSSFRFSSPCQRETRSIKREGRGDCGERARRLERRYFC
jgi:hypothetical protein